LTSTATTASVLREGITSKRRLVIASIKNVA
jgi:hypothetical protein